MGPAQRAEVEQSLNNRKTDRILNDPQINALRAFVDASTAKLLTGLSNQPEHVGEVTAMAVKQLETDPFTGMFNKKGFENQLKDAMDVAKKHNLDMRMLIVDGDNFGQINKNPALGYAIGDRVILAVAKGINYSAKRSSDIKGHISEDIEEDDNPITEKARQGGDEFAIIILGSDSEGIKKVEDQIRQNVTATVDEDVPEYRNHYGKSLTVSVGIAQFDPENDTPEKLLARADISLQAEKRLKKFGNIPLPDFSNVEAIKTWVTDHVKVPEPTQDLATEHQWLIQFADYARTHPRTQDEVLSIFVKAATREAA